jgi:putative hydrolase of the HAD superfamily
MTKIIIFDLGGVLVHLDLEGVCSSLAQLSDQGTGYIRDEIINGPSLKLSMRGLIGPVEFHESLCGKLGIDVSYDDFAAIWNGLLKTNEGIIPLVERLKPAHRLVLASNTDEIHFPYAVQHFAVLHHLDRYFLSYEMGLLKPEPALFLNIFESLGIAPDDCVFIDDTAENVESARSVGIAALQFGGVGKLQTDLAAIL